MNSKKIDLKELLKEKKKIALGGHVRPDGDCIGSVMGLFKTRISAYSDRRLSGKNT